MEWVRKYPVLAFVGLTAILQGLIIGLIAATALRESPPPGLLILLLWTPNIAALILSALIGGGPAARVLLGGWGRWRVSVWCYAVALSPLAIGFVAAAVYLLTGGEPSEPLVTLSPGMFIVFLIFEALYGPMGEELGWRGFMLPHLQRRFNALTSGVIVGLVWACWHLPFNLLPESTGLGIAIPFWQFAAITLGYSIIMTWLYNNTGGSVLLATLFHLSGNLAASFVVAMLGWAPLDRYLAIYAVPVLLFAIIVILAAGPEHLSRRAPRVTN
jgi:membrane protease YdiL (CAAX protease family)